MANVMQASSAPEFSSPEEWFHNLATRYVEVQIYFHLNQCGVFQKLKSISDPTHIASDLNLDERILRTLLEYVANVGNLLEIHDDDAVHITDFGHSVLNRYSKTNGEMTTYNMFDVRTGAWGPVWHNLGKMLRKESIYGQDFSRSGNFAADGLFKLAAPLISTVQETVELFEATTIVEIGPTSGLLAQLASIKSINGIRLLGLDVKQESLDDARNLADERGNNDIQWLRGDVNEPENWIDRISDGERVLYFSCHFHEFLSHGRPRLESALSKIHNAATTVGTLILEQPRLEQEDKNSVDPTKWLYAQSNVLIHHLIKNAKILSSNEWEEFLRSTGCKSIQVKPTNAYGFNGYVGKVN